MLVAVSGREVKVQMVAGISVARAPAPRARGAGTRRPWPSLPTRISTLPAMPDSTGPATHDERLKAALWHAVGRIVDTVAVDSSINASPTFIGGLTEMLAAKISTAATDIEAFAKHAGRSTVSSKDVVLLARHNDGLQEVLREKAEAARTSRTTTTTK